MFGLISLAWLLAMQGLVFSHEVDTERFIKLEEQWARECEPLLASSDYNEHLQAKTAQAFIRMGDDAVPFVLKRLNQSLATKRLQPTVPLFGADILPWHVLFEELCAKPLASDDEYERKVRAWATDKGDINVDLQIRLCGGPPYIAQVAVPHWSAWWAEKQIRRRQLKK